MKGSGVLNAAIGPPLGIAAAPAAAGAACGGDARRRPISPSSEAAAAKHDAATAAAAPLFEPAWEDEGDDGFLARLRAELAARK